MFSGIFSVFSYLCMFNASVTLIHVDTLSPEMCESGDAIGIITSVKLKRLVLHTCTLDFRNWNTIGLWMTLVPVARRTCRRAEESVEVFGSGQTKPMQLMQLCVCGSYPFKL